MVPQT